MGHEKKLRICQNIKHLFSLGKTYNHFVLKEEAPKHIDVFNSVLQ